MTTFDPEQTSYTADLRRWLAGFFGERSVEAYYFTAGTEVNYPYIVYELRLVDSFDDSRRSRRYVLEINAWDTESITALDNLLDFLEKEMDGYVHNDKRMTAVMYTAFGRIDVQEEHPLRRKRALFDLQYWNKEC